MAKKKEMSGSERPQEGSFETSFKRLEEILNTLESEADETSLEKVLECYQEGLQLIKACRAKLNEAEIKIEKINVEESSVQN